MFTSVLLSLLCYAVCDGERLDIVSVEANSVLNQYDVPQNLFDGKISTYYHSVADPSEKWIKIKVVPAIIETVVIEDR